MADAYIVGTKPGEPVLEAAKKGELGWMKLGKKEAARKPAGIAEAPVAQSVEPTATEQPGFFDRAMSTFRGTAQIGSPGAISRDEAALMGSIYNGLSAYNDSKAIDRQNEVNIAKSRWAGFHPQWADEGVQQTPYMPAQLIEGAHGGAAYWDTLADKIKEAEVNKKHSDEIRLATSAALKAAQVDPLKWQAFITEFIKHQGRSK